MPGKYPGLQLPIENEFPASAFVALQKTEILLNSEMKLIFNTLHERVLNLEIALQANNLTLERSSVVRNEHPLPDQKPTITKQGSSLAIGQHEQNLNVEQQTQKSHHSTSGICRDSQINEVS